MKTITRKTMLYQTGVEYGDYTMNHVQGCAHGCKFPCYAFLMKNALVRSRIMKNGWNRAWFPIRWNCWIERSQGSVIKFSLYNFASQRTLL